MKSKAKSVGNGSKAEDPHGGFIRRYPEVYENPGNASPKEPAGSEHPCRDSSTPPFTGPKPPELPIHVYDMLTGHDFPSELRRIMLRSGVHLRGYSGPWHLAENVPVIKLLQEVSALHRVSYLIWSIMEQSRLMADNRMRPSRGVHLSTWASS